MQLCEPAMEYSPVAHATGAPVGSSQYEPAGQAVHVLPDTYEPSGHEGEPVLTPPAHTSPAGHTVHEPEPALAYWPVLQAVGVPAPAGQANPAGHTRQAARPAGLYVPAAHVAGAEVGSAQDEPAGQGEHADAPPAL